MKITVKFYATEEEVYNWVMFYNRRAYTRLETYGIVGFALLIGLANILLPGANRLVGAVALTVALFTIYSPKLLAKISARRVDPDRVWQYEIDDSRLAIYSGSEQTVVDWNSFKQWAESSEAFYVIAGRHRYLIVPKSGFEARDAIDELRSFLSDKFKKLA